MSRAPLAVPAVIVHDWFAGYHGSDRVVETLRSCLFAPEFEPDVMTFHAEHDLIPPALAAAIVAESRLARLPGVRQRGHDNGRWRYLLPYMPRWFGRLDLDRYDLVLSSAHACAAGVHKRPGAVHVCYCHAPMRYAWNPEIDDRRAGPLASRMLRLLARRMRAADRRASRLPDVYVANSTAVQERIQRFYGRDSTVVHPPVDTAAIAPGPERRSGFLWVHRLVPYKQPLLVAESFRGLDSRLTMVGVGPLEGELRASLPENVELRGWVDRDELVELYRGAEGFIHVGEEDFGISMVEALAAGTPVIGLARGGATDIVRDGIDGLLIDDADRASLRAAISGIHGRDWDRGALSDRAREFSTERFVERMRAIIDPLLAG